jgi:hypothetical protein
MPDRGTMDSERCTWWSGLCKRSAMARHWSALVLGCTAMLATTAVVAQQTGTIRLIVDPGHNFQFVVDKKHRMEQREVTLTEGLHTLSIWAPERQVVDTPVFVVAGRTSDLIVRLPYSPAFLEYKRELGRFEARRTTVRAIPVVVTACGAIWTGGALGRYIKAHKQLEDDRTIYERSVEPLSIMDLKETTIPGHKKQFRQARTGFYVASGFTVLSAAATYYVFRRTGKWEKPVFNDPEKVRFEGLTWVPSPQGGYWATAITIPLAR